MMTVHLKDILAYLLKNYPHAAHLSNARVTKMVYLSDWRHAIKHKKQISNIDWIFSNHGPFVTDIENTIEQHGDLFRRFETTTFFGNKKIQFAFRNPDYIPQLQKSEKEAIDHVIKVTKDLSWDEFIHLVYSTYPIVASDKYRHLNLIDLANKYKSISTT